jgi:hypothetical protein
MKCPDSGVVESEIINAAAMLTQACRIGRMRLGSSPFSAKALGVAAREIVKEHRRLWLIRNRPGGLRDSVDRLRI